MNRRDAAHRAQPSLFDTPPPPQSPALTTATRIDHGRIHRDATYSEVSGDHAADRARVLDLVFYSGHNGITGKEIAAKLGRPFNEISGRLTELAQAGRILRPGHTRAFNGEGRPCLICYVPKCAPPASTTAAKPTP